MITPNDRIKILVGSLLVFISGSLFSLYFAQYLYRTNTEAMQKALESSAYQISDRITRQFEIQVNALSRLANRWRDNNGMEHERWLYDAKALVKDFGNIKAVEWADQQFIIRWIEPMKGNEAALNFNVAFNEARLKHLTEARQRGRIDSTPVIKLKQGGLGVVVYVPIGEKENFQGFIVGVFLVDTLLSSLIQAEEDNHLFISVFEGERRIYSNRIEQAESSFIAAADWKPLNFDWQLTVLPQPEWESIYLNNSPNIMLITGLICSFLFASATYLIFYNRYQRRYLQRANNELTHAISSREKAEQDLTHVSNHDSLTGLPNRTFFYEGVKQAIKQTKQRHNFLAVFVIDVDHFKKINDTLGHSSGDRIVRELSQRMRLHLQGEITLSRIGGDEFSLLLEEITSVDQVISCAVQIRECFIKPFTLGEKDIFLTSSIGITLYPEGGNSADALIKNADVALYQAKDAGRDNYQFFTTGMQAQALRRLELDSLLRDAIRYHQLSLVYQPKISLLDDSITGAEVLLRWNHPEKGFISPAEFIPLAEETGMIRSIGLWVVEHVCQQLQNWKSEGFREIKLAINLSPNQLQDRDLKQSLLTILQKYDVQPSQLELELTEEVFIANMKNNQLLLQELTELGFQLTIDDFGVGYSSLAYLRNFPITAIKIDRTFVSNLEKNKDDQIIVNAVIAMAHNLSFYVIAEGVETAEQAEYLRIHNCDQVQGYYYSKPVSAEELEVYMSRSEKILSAR